tara:strand:- start:928 stop:1149 length:222 start_codon:yes stop_codon:yes gene_type:complete
MDLGLSLDPRESFRLFQGMILEQYDSMAEPEGFEVLDGTQSVHDLQIRTRSVIRKVIDLECYRHEDRRGADHD